MWSKPLIGLAPQGSPMAPTYKALAHAHGEAHPHGGANEDQDRIRESGCVLQWSVSYWDGVVTVPLD